MGNKFLLLLLGLLMLGSVSAWSNSTFNNSLSSENITFGGNENYTRWLNVPEDIIVTNAVMNLSGLGFKYYYNVSWGETSYISNPSFEDTGNWTYSETDVDFVGDYSTGWFTNGSRSYKLSLADDLAIDNAYAQILQSINFTDLQIIRFDVNYNSAPDGAADASIYIGGVEKIDFGFSATGSYQIDVSDINGIQDLVFRLYVVFSLSSPGPMYFYIDNIEELRSDWYTINYTNDSYIQINNTQIWNHTGGFNTTTQISNFAQIINNYISTASAVAGYYLIPFIFHSDTIGILEYFNLDFSNDGVLENSQTYNSTTYESSIENFEINFTYDSSKWLDVSATLYYNGTGYEGDGAGSGDDLTFNTSVTIPSVDSDTNITFYWTIALINTTGTYYYNSTFYNQTILTFSDLEITDGACSAGNFAAVNYTFADERNLTSLNANIKYNFKFGIGDLTANVVSGTFTGISSFAICINQTMDSYKLGYGEIEYDLTGYVSRRYYMFEGQALSNSTTNNITIYQLESGKATSFLFEIKNTFLNPYVDKLVGLLRWYPQENEYKVVELAKTDEDGQSLMKVEVEDVDYRIGVYNLDGTLIKLAEPVRMACLIEPCTLTLTIISDDVSYFDAYGIESSLTFDEDNNRFVYIWNDPSQSTESMRLLVIKESGFQEVVICNSTGSGYTGVLTCNIGSYTGELTAKAFRTASPESILAIFSTRIGLALNNTFGLFAAWMLMLIAAFAGVWSPVAAIILSIPGLILAVIFGSINFTIFMGIVVLAGLIIHMIKKTR